MGTTPAPVPVKKNEVQGLIVRPFTHPVSAHLLVRFDTPGGARAFLAALTPLVTTAESWGDPRPPRLLCLALSWAGLAAARALSTDALMRLPKDFRGLPPPESLGDVGVGRQWWDNAGAGRLHCLVNLWAETREDLAGFIADVEGHAAEAGVTVLRVRPDGDHIRGALFTEKRQLHFGYSDGISRPEIDWDDAGTPGSVNYRNYLVGRGTEENLSSWEPLSTLGPGLREAADFIRDGTFLVFRVMHQDVAAFNRFLGDNARLLAPALARTEAETAEWLAAKMMGRWRSGEPLVLAPDGPDAALARSDDFDYVVDPAGERCPPSAHIRVVNPRGEPIDEGEKPAPRLLRRGMPYGDPLAGTADDHQERGLIGIFLCNSPRAQFEKLMGWIRENNFSPVYQDNRQAQDALLGNRNVPLASQKFRIPVPNRAPVIPIGLMNFVVPRGTAYFFLPSLPALGRLGSPPA